MPLAKFGLFLIFVNKVLLDNSYAHSFYHLWFHLFSTGGVVVTEPRRPAKPETVTMWPLSKKKFCWFLIYRNVLKGRICNVSKKKKRALTQNLITWKQSPIFKFLIMGNPSKCEIMLQGSILFRWPALPFCLRNTNYILSLHFNIS